MITVFGHYCQHCEKEFLLGFLLNLMILCWYYKIPYLMQYCSKNSIRNQSSYHYHACKNVNNSPVVFRRCGKHQRGEKFSCGKGAAVWSIVGAGVHNLQSWDCLVYDHCSLHVRINLQVIMAIRHVDKNSLYLWNLHFCCYPKASS